jgi:hypothetical protein
MRSVYFMNGHVFLTLTCVVLMGVAKVRVFIGMLYNMLEWHFF